MRTKYNLQLIRSKNEKYIEGPKIYGGQDMVGTGYVWPGDGSPGM